MAAPHAPLPPFSPSPLPGSKQLKYKQVELELRKIAETLPIGAKMPPERELALAYGCSVLTLRKGMDALVRDGLIERKIGSGTFVLRRSDEPVLRERMLGVLVHRESDAYAYRVLRSVAHAALERSLHPRSIWLGSFDEEARRRIQELRREGCTAFTMPWFPPALRDRVQNFLRETGVPISLPQIVPGFESYCFEAPELFGRHTEKVTELLCEYFNLLGVKRIALLGPDTPHNQILNEQLMAYTRAMSRREQPVLCYLVGSGAPAMDALAKRWAEYRGELGVICYDDEHALRFMISMHKLGFAAPTDFRIIGYNNTDAARYSDPPLTSVAQDFDSIANRLVTSALALAEGRVEQATELPASLLVVRDTCGGATGVNDDIRHILKGLEFSFEPSPR